MNEQNASSRYKTLLEQHPAFLVSMLYFLASLIGLVYSWAYLHGFGINVFRYADISDFLLASLKEPFTWLLVVLIACLIAADNAMSLYVQKRGPGRFFRWYASERYRRINYVSFVILVSIGLFTYAERNAQRIQDGGGNLVSVELTDSLPPENLVLIATTARFVFFYDRKSKQVAIHPIDNILTIRKPSPAAKLSQH